MPRLLLLLSLCLTLFACGTDAAEADTAVAEDPTIEIHEPPAVTAPADPGRYRLRLEPNLADRPRPPSHPALPVVVTPAAAD